MRAFRVAWGRSVIVNLRTGGAVRGVLLREAHRSLELRSCAYVREDGSATPVDGAVIIPADNVDFVQVIAHPAAPANLPE